MKEAVGMKKRMIPVFLAGLMMLGGCSAYHRKEVPSSSGLEIERVETLPTEAEGPTLSQQEQWETTVPALELEQGTESHNNPEIVIASDIHYLAKELTDFGPAFEHMVETGDGKVTTYVWEITDAFIDEVIQRRPQALILSGDLTLEGERVSHEALAQKLRQVENAGIPVFVIPGNHDINNAKAASFRGGETIPAVTTTPEAFAEIYEEFGYGEAVNRDPESLSYVAELKDGTWLLMLDSCQYENGAMVGGMIRTETYQWMDQVLDDAWFEDRQVIAVAHHNLLDESRIYEKDCTIEHAEELGEKLNGWEIGLFLSGHLHVQHYKYSENYDVDEIVTGSLSTSPCLYGVLKYFGPHEFDYHTESVDVTAWAEGRGNPDFNLQEFSTYADGFLQQVFYNQAREGLSKHALSVRERNDMAELYALLNVYSVAGRAWEIKEETMKRPAYELWQEYNRTDILSMYLEEILEDAVCNYNVRHKP